MLNDVPQPKTLHTLLASIQHVQHHQQPQQRQQQQQQQQQPRHPQQPGECMKWSQIELIYRAEGNANLVLALPQFKKVLRLPKMHPTLYQQQQQQQQQEDASTSAKGVEHLGLEHFAAYIEIIRCLLGTEFIFQVDIMHIPTPADAAWINEHIRAARPAHRREKEFCGQFGLLLPDAALLPSKCDALLLSEQLNKKATVVDADADTFAIEIKPKQGWLLLPTDVNDLFDIRPTAMAPPTTTTKAKATTVTTTTTTSDVQQAGALHANGCRYCAMQYLKLDAGKINKLSAYCPIELFSGVDARMLSALTALFECPQNNLRVCRNGALIYGDHIDSLTLPALRDTVFKGAAELELIKRLLVACLLRDFQPALETVAFKAHSASAPAQAPALAMTGTKAVKEATKTAKATKATTKATTKGATKGTAVDVERVAVTVGQPCSSAASTATKTATTKTRTTTTITTTTPATSGAPETKTVASTEAAAQTQINVAAEVQCLPKNCVLQKILNLQLLAKNNLRHMLDSGTPAAKGVKSYKTLETLLRKAFEPATPTTTTPTTARTQCLNFDDLTAAEQYLLGATALDCSIMITFKQIRQSQLDKKYALGNPHVVHLPGADRSYVVNVTLIDLDPKPDSHCHNYMQQTRQAFAATAAGAHGIKR